MIRVERRGVAFALFFSVMLIGGCQSGVSPMGLEFKRRTQFESEWSKYRELQPNKALAIAGDVQARYVLGYAHELADESSAIEQALADCEQRRADRSLDAPCRLFAVNGERVD
jgi:hypothetical protein